ncbi:MAG TPA: TIGR03435 family protein [Bryobacteraceae bacterium]|jgi:uncharacterized protein (TIGR03435 family)
MIRLFLLTACVALAQTPAARPAFEVASVKANASSKGGGEGSRRENAQVSPGSVILRNVSMRTAIRWAYNVQEFQVTGPAWIADERYDIDAKAAGPATEAQMRLMMRTLLADRFKLAAHTTQKEMQTMAAVVAKGGSKLKAAENQDGPMGIVPGAAGVLIVKSITTEEAAGLLSGPLQMPVVDETGLKGRFDVMIDMNTYIADLRKQAGQPDIGTIIDVLNQVAQDQLGLKLESRKAPVEMLVVESAEGVPTEN